MKNIRHNVFETNSSSTHSISITENTDGMYESIPVDDKGVISLAGMNFGWEWEKYNESWIKANYAAQLAFSSQRVGLPQNMEMFLKVMTEHTGARYISFIFNPNEWYIDHQSDAHEGGDGLEAFNSEKSLRDFIFDPRSWLLLGNDNEESPGGFHDTENIKLPYTLRIANSLFMKRFESKPSEEKLKSALCGLFRHHPDFINSKFQIMFGDIDTNGSKLESIVGADANHITLFESDSDPNKLFEAKMVSNSIVIPIQLTHDVAA